MSKHRNIFFTALLTIAFLCAQSTYAHGTAPKAITLDSVYHRFPYDTTVSICNSTYSQGIKAVGMDVGMQYLGLKKQGRIAIIDTGKSEIVIQNVYTNDPDQAWILGSIVNNWIFPDTLQPGDTLWLGFTFAPSNGGNAGARHYEETYNIVSSAGDTISVTAGGTGVLVDMYTHIDTTYVCSLDSTVIVSLMVDSLIDPIGNANIYGYVMEMTHYDRSVVMLDTAYNLGVNLNGTNAQGQQGTLSQGATVTENIPDDWFPEHTGGSHAYYEIDVYGTLNQIENSGTLIKFKYRRIAMGSSQLVYGISTVYDNNGNTIDYVRTHWSPGIITVIAPSQFGFSVYPNPFDQSAAIHFSINNPTHAKLTVYNSIGQTIGTILDQDLTPGDFTANFTGAGLPNGIYFYTLTTTNNGTYRGRMELMR
ncbi:MAG TPA: T9SS type A sorting domain-containing protein [Candidatus Kapabacteria bacterium]|nr:T9SS type A sorting domain-containing protein [Candidatus Kapabacteria bacterium]